MFQAVRLVLAALMFIIVTSACGGSDGLPPTELVIISPAPTVSTQSVDWQATIDALQLRNQALMQTIEAVEPSPVAATMVAVAPTEQALTLTATPQPTETLRPSIFPTSRAEIVSVVEQVFEGGRMIWFRESRQVAVLIGEGVDPVEGQWVCFEDTFTEGDIEFVATLQPPSGATTSSAWPDAVLQQPIRGFGKIWRENPTLREQLGWAITPEIEHSPAREYVAGGRVENDTYIPGPGEYRVWSFFQNAVILLYETELDMPCPAGTWRVRQPS